MKKILVAMMSVCALLVAAGCSEDTDMNNPVTKTFVGPKTLPIWLLVRKSNELDRTYQATTEEGEAAVNSAIVATGGTVRYSTAVGSARTVYALTSDNRSIVVDVDPAGKGLCKIIICVDMYGNKKDSRKILEAIALQPVSKVEEVKEVKVETVVKEETPAAPCPAKGCDK